MKHSTPERKRLRLLSYNIQAGIASSKFRHYFTHSWKHLLPHPERLDNLDRMSGILGDFDIVGLQEADGGSRRSSFVNLTEYLALQASFPHWYDQTNRTLGSFARHSLGLLSRVRPSIIREIKLPGAIPGRGALMARFGHGDNALMLAIAHLALGRRSRLRQLGHLAELVSDYRHVILMGDFNCGTQCLEMNWFLDRARLREPVHGLHTFPSWRPQRSLDHILVSPTLEVARVHVLNHAISDHLPIAMEVLLPSEIGMPREQPGASDALPLAAGAGF